MDKACELCYVAKKYMLPVVVQKCTEFLWSDLNSRNVCRAFEFAKLFEEPALAERCLQVMNVKLKNACKITIPSIFKPKRLFPRYYRSFAAKRMMYYHRKALKKWNCQRC